MERLRDSIWLVLSSSRGMRTATVASSVSFKEVGVKDFE